MKRLVILGEGHGEMSALPILARKLLREKDSERRLFVDDEIIRTHNPLGLVKWNKQQSQPDYEEWLRYIRIAARRSNVGGILAVFDGDADKFPAGADFPFCPATAAKSMAAAASQIGAGRSFSLAIVFACIEFESWIIAGAEALAGQSFRDGRSVLYRGVAFPAGNPESHGKGWLEKNCPGYRPRRDQGPLTELLDLNVVRSKGLRSFSRLDNAVDELLNAIGNKSFIVTP
jgi:Domain of unknown function (DUF4276)